MLRLFLALWLAVTPAFAWAGSMALLGAGKAPVAATGGCFSGWTGPTSGLTHCWPMDNAHVSGTTILDTVGSINGTAGPNVTAGTGPSTVAGTARTFDGTTAPIQLASLPIGTQPVTIAAWLNRVDNTSNDAFDQRWVCFGGTSGVDFMLSNGNNTGTANVQVLGSTEATAASSTTVGAWHHYAITYNGTTALLYVDGSAVALSGAGAGDACDVGATWLGGRNATARLWAGSESTTVVYNRVLSSSEITTLFNAK